MARITSSRGTYRLRVRWIARNGRKMTMSTRYLRAISFSTREPGRQGGSPRVPGRGISSDGPRALQSVTLTVGSCRIRLTL